MHPASPPICVQSVGDDGDGAAELGDAAPATPVQIRLPSLIDIPQSLIEVQNVGNVVKVAHIISNPEEV